MLAMMHSQATHVDDSMDRRCAEMEERLRAITLEVENLGKVNQTLR